MLIILTIGLFGLGIGVIALSIAVNRLGARVTSLENPKQQAMAKELATARGAITRSLKPLPPSSGPTTTSQEPPANSSGS